MVPGKFGEGWELGDVGFCYNTHTEDNMFWTTGDIGPRDKIGEISIYLAKCLKVNPDPKRGGIASGIVYVVFPGSNKVYMPWTLMMETAIEKFNEWGGLSKLKPLISQI